jgi:hypothetical protein
MSNAQLEALLMDLATTESDMRASERLLARLIDRENDALDLLRARAAEQGLMPGVVAYVLMETGLGDDPTPMERVLITRQAHEQSDELERRLNEFRRKFGGEMP